MRKIIAISLFALLLLYDHAARSEEAAPDQQILPVPEGWVFVRLSPGGFIMEHEDGSRVRVEQLQCGNRYGVVMTADYPSDESREPVTVRERAVGTTDMSIRIRIWPNGRREVRHLTVPWPERIRQTFLRFLDPATRSVIHNE